MNPPGKALKCLEMHLLNFLVTPGNFYQCTRTTLETYWILLNPETPSNDLKSIWNLHKAPVYFPQTSLKSRERIEIIWRLLKTEFLCILWHTLNRFKPPPKLLWSPPYSFPNVAWSPKKPSWIKMNFLNRIETPLKSFGDPRAYL